MNKIVFGVVIVFLAICIVVLFTAILIKLYISKIKKYNAVLYQKEIAQQQAINEAILETQDTTLNSISRELHDDAGQQLTYINFQLENLKLTNPPFYQHLEPISESITQLSITIRDLSHSINQQNIKSNTLTQSISQQIDQLNKLNIVSCSLHIDENFDYKFSSNEKIILYRIFQEISNNMMKHSKATNFQVMLSQSPEVSLTFKDDGIGFSLENSNLQSSNGLNNIQDRAQLINYSFRINTKTNEGTCIQVQKTEH
jgi:signal transduction histidine kinase